jgi:hypothetical protein
MLLRKPLPLWINVSLFAVSVGMLPLAGQVGRRPVSTPGTRSEITERLSRCTPTLYVVPQFPNRAESAIWICTQPHSREQLWGMVCDPKRVDAGQWIGIVSCKCAGPSWVLEFEDEFIRSHWGECAMRVGPFVFFGDPDLLRRIYEVIVDYKS